MDLCEEENDICTQEENECVDKMVKVILILDHSKKPFKQADMLKLLGQKPNRKTLNSIVQKAKNKLKEMGLNLVDVKNTSTKSYFLTSSVFPLPSMYKFAPENEVADRTLLILVLTFIFVKEGSVTNVDIFNHLQQLNIYSKEKPIHNYFGDIKKKILTVFVSQLYLEKVVDKEKETFEIKWGERALAEVSKQSILKFVCEVGYEGKIQPIHLASQYQEVLQEEALNNEKQGGAMIVNN